MQQELPAGIPHRKICKNTVTNGLFTSSALQWSFFRHTSKARIRTDNRLNDCCAFLRCCLLARFFLLLNAVPKFPRDDRLVRIINTYCSFFIVFFLLQLKLKGLTYAKQSMNKIFCLLPKQRFLCWHSQVQGSETFVPLYCSGWYSFGCVLLDTETFSFGK